MKKIRYKKCRNSISNLETIAEIGYLRPIIRKLTDKRKLTNKEPNEDIVKKITYAKDRNFKPKLGTIYEIGDLQAIKKKLTEKKSNEDMWLFFQKESPEKANEVIKEIELEDKKILNTIMRHLIDSYTDNNMMIDYKNSDTKNALKRIKEVLSTKIITALVSTGDISINKNEVIVSKKALEAIGISSHNNND